MPPLTVATTRLRAALPYLVAAALAALATAGRVALARALGEELLLLLAYPAVAFVSWRFGFRPAVACMALCAVGALAVPDPEISSGPAALRLTIFFGAGAFIAALAAARDWTASRLDTAEQAKRTGEEQLRVITDAAPALISYIDDQLRYVLVNRTYQRWFGIEPAAVRGKHVREVLGEQAWAGVRAYMARALAGEVVRYEQQVPYAAGSRWVDVTYTPDRAPDGRVRGFVVLVHDIASTKEAEATLRRVADRADRLRRIATALSECLTHAQVARVIVDEGVPALEAAGARVVRLLDDAETLERLDDPSLPDDQARLPLAARAPLADALRERAPVLVASPAERAARYPDGAAWTALDEGASASLPLVVHGRPLGALGFTWTAARAFTDDDLRLLRTFGDQCAQALDRARLYAAEQEARAHAEAANRAKDEFLAMLGHELRNPLAPIMTALHLLELRGATSKEWSVVERQARHLAQLVDDLLDVARVARGKLELRRGDVDALSALARALEIAGPLLEQRRHTVQVDLPAPPLRVTGDETRLAQVFANLLTNAAKYTPEGGHVVVRAARDGGEVVVTVQDDGAGIAPELLPRIFDLFVQGPRALDRREGGLGLGLALVRNIVALHGGTVEARSDGPGRGSAFTVRLPLAEGAAPAAVPAPAAARPDGPRLAVLVVDDNADAAATLQELLASLGHDVRVAHDGPRALQVLDGFAADVAVLDLGLPVMDGVELGRLIRARGAGPALVALTGYGQAEARARTEAAGFAAHLVKPITLEALTRTLDALRPGARLASA
ncbi:MAG: PAS domain-containing protein [Planctomycetes bacterium]|nr:PAS domain-containing protein [Planctomycetota bacterium]